MATKTGICPNAAGCTLAYTKKPITVAEGAEFRCPECGQTLQDAAGATVGGGAKLPVWVVAAGIAGVFVIAAAFVVVPRMMSHSDKPSAPEPSVVKNEPIATPAPPEPAPATPVPATPAPVPSPVATPTVAIATPVPAATPVAMEKPAATPIPVAPEPVPSNAGTTITPLVENKEENAEVKKQVLSRIDSMPNLSPTNRSKLYTAVDRARGMYKMAIINFDSGRVAPTGPAVTQLVEGLHTPGVQRLLTDPTAVLIVLGYADSKGDDKKNLQISTDRAESLTKALREQGKIMNVMHAVGMGGSEMFGKGQRDKNRVVEVWAVLP
jgi:hypothetical protein